MYIQCPDPKLSCPVLWVSERQHPNTKQTPMFLLIPNPGSLSNRCASYLPLN